MKVSSIQPKVYLYAPLYQKPDKKQVQNIPYMNLPDFKGKCGFYTSHISFGGLSKSSQIKNEAFYSDTKNFSKYLHEKIKNELRAPTIEDVRKAVIDETIKHLS